MESIRLSRMAAALLVGIIVVGSSMTATPIAQAQPSENCRPEAMLSTSAPEVGVVHGQAAAYCMVSPQRADATVTAEMFRNGVRTSSRTNRCAPGQFRGNYCSVPVMYATNPGGAQTFRLVVTIRFIPIAGAAAVTASTNTTGYY